AESDSGRTASGTRCVGRHSLDLVGLGWSRTTTFAIGARGGVRGGARGGVRGEARVGFAVGRAVGLDPRVAMLRLHVHELFDYVRCRSFFDHLFPTVIVEGFHDDAGALLISFKTKVFAYVVRDWIDDVSFEHKLVSVMTNDGHIAVYVLLKQ
ncbi:hypothetical protein T492DRAFT_389740, partial [Pavlovales sp. CCMP2436]